MHNFSTVVKVFFEPVFLCTDMQPCSCTPWKPCWLKFSISMKRSGKQAEGRTQKGTDQVPTSLLCCILWLFMKGNNSYFWWLLRQDMYLHFSSVKIQKSYLHFWYTAIFLLIFLMYPCKISSCYCLFGFNNSQILGSSTTVWVTPVFHFLDCIMN